jgi:RND family efflux transporter MFP subunit
MKILFSLLLILSCIQISCRQPHAHDHADGLIHDAQGNHIDPATAVPEPLSYTLYTDKTELFVEFRPLVVGTQSRFAAHLTALGEYFKAIGEGSVTLTLKGAQGSQSVTAEKPEVPGIFRLSLTPEKTGVYDLVFDIKTPAYTDQILIESINVYADNNAALTSLAHITQPGTSVSFTKEQAWQIDFAAVPAKVLPFQEVIRTSGQLISAPADEALLIAQIDGIVSLSGRDMVVGKPVKAGELAFVVSSNENVKGALSAEVEKAENDLRTARANYERAGELVKDKIISEKEYLEARLRFENAETTLKTARISSGFNTRKQNITVPMSGFVRNILVANGQYVTAGQPLGSISRNQKLILRADLSQRYFSKLSSVTAANFRTSDGSKIYSTRELNGKLVSYGKSIDTYTPFVPLSFEIDNDGGLIPGSIVEVYLLSGNTSSLVIPYSSLLEEQGIFYVFVQTSGESFQKREVKTGSTDGINVQVISGVRPGEWVVSKGAYQIKLSTASGQLPAHGHEH